VAQYRAQVFRTPSCCSLNDVRDWICATGEVHNDAALIVGTALIWFSTLASGYTLNTQLNTCVCSFITSVGVEACSTRIPTDSPTQLMKKMIERAHLYFSQNLFTL
jgi:hypothetical protein